MPEGRQDHGATPGTPENECLTQQHKHSTAFCWASPLDPRWHWQLVLSSQDQCRQNHRLRLQLAEESVKRFHQHHSIQVVSGWRENAFGLHHVTHCLKSLESGAPAQTGGWRDPGEPAVPPCGLGRGRGRRAGGGASIGSPTRSSSRLLLWEMYKHTFL